VKLGTNERGKVAALALLGLVAGYLVYSNVFSGPSPGGPPPAAAVAPVSEPASPLTPSAPEPARPPSRAAAARGRSDEFRPTLRSNRPEERIDPMRIDPTLRLDLLAKLDRVTAPAAGRNLFQFGMPPVKAAEALKGPEPKVAPKPVKVEETKVEPPKPPGPPPPPPINLKYYGFSSAPGNNAKTAFFLDGEDILVAKEGETLKRRYRVVRIGINSVVMEDTESKHQQTLPLAEEAAG
jgi:hypothetical protein